MTDVLNICPKCGQDMHLNWDEEPMFFYHPAWIKQNIDPPCSYVIDQNDIIEWIYKDD
jgi:hypothetical protein